VSQHHETKPMHPSLQRAFQLYQEHDWETHGLRDFTITNKAKQNKQPIFRYGLNPYEEDLEF